MNGCRTCVFHLGATRLLNSARRGRRGSEWRSVRDGRCRQNTRLVDIVLHQGQH